MPVVVSTCPAAHAQWIIAAASPFGNIDELFVQVHISLLDTLLYPVPVKQIMKREHAAATHACLPGPGRVRSTNTLSHGYQGLPSLNRKQTRLCE